MSVLFSSKNVLSTLGIGIFSIGIMVLTTRCSGTEKTESISETAQNEALEFEKDLKEKADLFFRSSVTALPKEDIPDNKIQLGKKLFFDNRLSKNETISCNSCHDLNAYGVDNLALSLGDTEEFGDRNSPTVFYAHLHSMQFWDGRAKDVEEQAEGPLLNPVEHSIPSVEYLENKVREIAEYQTLFAEVFPDSVQPITMATITNAIGAFERQLSPPSRFDEWMDGDSEALTAEEKRGMREFIDKGCITCHNGPALGGTMLQKMGLYDDYWKHTGSKVIDKGRYNETGNEKDMYVFKVPGLRNVEKTYPYFHDGSVESLEESVRIMGKLQVKGGLDDSSVVSITTFLKCLTADIPDEYKNN